MSVPTLRFRFNPDTPRLRVRVYPAIPPLEASFRSDGTNIQWRLGEDGAWQDLIAVDDINASVTVGTTTTLPFGSDATVTNSGTDQDVVLDFGIPGATASEILTALLTVDGTGSGLDADTLDGLNSDAFQPIDSDLTAIAGLSTAAYGRSLLTLANATALAAEVDAFFLTPTEGNAAYQPLDSDLTAIAALTTTTYGRSLLTPADAAAARTLLGVGAGTGDLVSTNNLSDVASAVASHDNITTRGSDVASAATLNLDSATGAFVDITGTTAVTAVTLTSGRQRMARASGAFRLTASSTLVVNGSTTASYTTNAGDLLLFEGYGSSVVNVWTINTPQYNLAPYPSGHLYGLTLSNNSGTPNSVVDIAAGACRDSTDAANIDLLSTLSKSLASGWAVGSGNGGLDTGSEATSTWYHVWGIKRPDTGVVDGLFSLSATSPTMPSNYTLKRRLGAVYNDSSGNIKAFFQSGDRFWWDVITQDVLANNPGTSASTRTLSVPTGIAVDAQVVIRVVNDSAGIRSRGVLSSLAQTDTAASDANSQVDTGSAAGAAASDSASTVIRTNTSAQIRSRLSASAASVFLEINTIGWFDTRS